MLAVSCLKICCAAYVFFAACGVDCCFVYNWALLAVVFQWALLFVPAVAVSFIRGVALAVGLSFEYLCIVGLDYRFHILLDCKPLKQTVMLPNVDVNNDAKLFTDLG